MARENLTSLTSLRFFAAASIVWLHAKLYFDWAQAVSVLSFNGVSFFFVLSGFILTHVHGNGPIPYGRFMMGRVARLWPLHVVCLLAVMLVVPSGSQAYDGAGFGNKWVSLTTSLFLAQSWVPTFASVYSWNSVSWSISTEMFFYAMFPLLIVLLRWSRTAFLLVCFLPTLALWVIARSFDVPPASDDAYTVTLNALFYSFPLARLFEFGLGIVACRVWQHFRTRSESNFAIATSVEVAGLVLMAAWFMWAFPTLTPYALKSPVLWQWFASSGSCFVFAIFIALLASGRGAVGKILALRPLVVLGEVSFAIYMVHMIVMKIMPADSSLFAVMSAIAIASFAGHYLCEVPARRFILRDRARRISAPVVSIA